MNKKDILLPGMVLNTLGGYLAALLRRISRNWGGKQLQPIPVKARN